MYTQFDFRTGHYSRNEGDVWQEQDGPGPSDTYMLRAGKPVAVACSDWLQSILHNAPTYPEAASVIRSALASGALDRSEEGCRDNHRKIMRRVAVLVGADPGKVWP